MGRGDWRASGARDGAGFGRSRVDLSVETAWGQTIDKDSGRHINNEDG